MEQVDEDRDLRAVEAAKTQALFRTVNERVEQLNEAFTPLVADGEWVCECADLVCVRTISMRIDEYEHIRSHPNRFFVSPGHVDPAVERVVETHERYEIVEKFGEAAALAVAADQRRRSSGEIARARNDALHGRQKAVQAQSEDLESG